MGSQSREVKYGRTDPQSAGPALRVVAGTPLRLCHGPYPFDEPPDLVRLATVEDRMALLCEHLKGLCRPWDKTGPLFLDAYFDAVAAAIAGARDEVAHLAARTGALFAPADWSFAALRPLPQAHLGHPTPARAEIAFWTGARFLAIAFEGSGSATRAEREALARIEAGGDEVVHIPVRAIAPGAGGELFKWLPRECAEFWRGITLPSSPFGPEIGEF